LELCRDLVFCFDRIQGVECFFLDIIAVFYQILDPIATAASGGRAIHRDRKSGVFFLVWGSRAAAGGEQHHNQES
jgi:hypothetical protein